MTSMAWLGAVLMLVPAQAEEFECIPAQGRLVPTQVWTTSNRCIPFYINDESDLVSSEGRQQLVRESFSAWSDPECTDLVFSYRGLTSAREGFDRDSDDNRNVVLQVLDDDDLGQLVIAATLTFHSVDTGEIFDADVILNATEFNAFGEVTAPQSCLDAQPPFNDLRNTLVHEFGHFIGFDHNRDSASTMAPQAPECETIKRSLNETDLAGLCSVYPAGAASQTCEPPDDYGDFDQFRNQCNPPDEGGCQGGPPPWAPGIIAVAWFIGLRRRRRLTDR